MEDITKAIASILGGATISALLFDLIWQNPAVGGAIFVGSTAFLFYGLKDSGL